MRPITRLTGVSKNTVSKLLNEAGLACAEYHDHTVRNLQCRRVQVDEIWSFAYAKQKNVQDAKAALRAQVIPGRLLASTPTQSSL